MQRSRLGNLRAKLLAVLRDASNEEESGSSHTARTSAGWYVREAPNATSKRVHVCASVCLRIICISGDNLGRVPNQSAPSG